MTISELARRAGIAPSAIRWYEGAGVLPTPPRAANGYRRYDHVDLARIRLLVSLRRLGLTPEDAGRLAAACIDGGVVPPDLAPSLAQQRAAIALQREQLERLDAELLDLELTLDAVTRRGTPPTPSHLEAPVSVPIRVLFVCTGNSARSQLGEALLEHLGGPEFAVESAGTDPKGVNPLAVEVLAEVGIDWSAATSKGLDGFLGQPFDYVITVCDRARQACPVFPGSGNALHWGLEDPAEVTGTHEERREAFRRTRQELSLRLRPFIEIARRTAGVPAGSVVGA